MLGPPHGHDPSMGSVNPHDRAGPTYPFGQADHPDFAAIRRWFSSRRPRLVERFSFLGGGVDVRQCPQHRRGQLEWSCSFGFRPRQAAHTPSKSWRTRRGGARWWVVGHRELLRALTDIAPPFQRSMSPTCASVWSRHTVMLTKSSRLRSNRSVLDGGERRPHAGEVIPAVPESPISFVGTGFSGTVSRGASSASAGRCSAVFHSAPGHVRRVGQPCSGLGRPGRATARAQHRWASSTCWAPTGRGVERRWLQRRPGMSNRPISANPRPEGVIRRVLGPYVSRQLSGARRSPTGLELCTVRPEVRSGEPFWAVRPFRGVGHLSTPESPEHRNRLHRRPVSDVLC